MTSASNGASGMVGREIWLLRLAGSPQQELNMAMLPSKRLIVEESHGILWAVLWEDIAHVVPWEIRRYNLAHCTTIQWKDKV